MAMEQPDSISFDKVEKFESDYFKLALDAIRHDEIGILAQLNQNKLELYSQQLANSYEDMIKDVVSIINMPNSIQLSSSSFQCIILYILQKNEGNNFLKEFSVIKLMKKLSYQGSFYGNGKIKGEAENSVNTFLDSLKENKKFFVLALTENLLYNCRLNKNPEIGRTGEQIEGDSCMLRYLLNDKAGTFEFEEKNFIKNTILKTGIQFCKTKEYKEKFNQKDVEEIENLLQESQLLQSTNEEYSIIEVPGKFNKEFPQNNRQKQSMSLMTKALLGGAGIGIVGLILYFLHKNYSFYPIKK